MTLDMQTLLHIMQTCHGCSEMKSVNLPWQVAVEHEFGRYYIRLDIRSWIQHLRLRRPMRKPTGDAGGYFAGRRVSILHPLPDYNARKFDSRLKRYLLQARQPYPHPRPHAHLILTATTTSSSPPLLIITLTFTHQHLRAPVFFGLSYASPHPHTRTHCHSHPHPHTPAPQGIIIFGRSYVSPSSSSSLSLSPTSTSRHQYFRAFACVTQRRLQCTHRELCGEGDG